MENRVLLAFVLSLLVFFGWGYFLSVVKKPPIQKKEDVQKEAKKVPPAVIAPTDPDSAGVVRQPSTEEMSRAIETGPPPLEFPGKEVQINVVNGDITYVFSNQGATLRDMFLNQFADNLGQQINLVKKSDGASWPLSIESSDASVTRILQNAFYEHSAQYLELNEFNPSATLTFRLTHSSGLEVVKELTFQYNSYLINVQTRISTATMANKNLQYKVLWGPGLGGAIASKTDYFVFSGPTTFVNDERVENPPEELTGEVRHMGNLEWTAFQNKYFAAALIPGSGTKAAIVKKEGDALYVGLELESVQSAASASYLLYAGTKQISELESSGHKLIRLMDYGWFGNKFAFLVKPLLKVLNYFYEMTNNYGWSIIFVTIIIKILFFPLTHKSFKSMKGMQKIQPYVKLIQERNKDDRQKMNEEMLELYKKHKVNPLGGCLPMLLQIPVFIALYHALFFSIELRGAPFILWITDLSVRDPYYVTPVLMGATMFLQQRLSPSMGDPMQQKIMMFLPVVFTFLFISFPAGLVIYWTVNNMLTIAQQFYIYKIAKT